LNLSVNEFNTFLKLLIDRRANLEGLESKRRSLRALLTSKVEWRSFGDFLEQVFIYERFARH